MFISLAQRNGTKETSTLSKPSPIWEGCKLRFAETDKPSHVLVTRDYALVFFFGCARFFREIISFFSRVSHECFVLFFGAKKRTKRSIHPIQTFPYMGRLNCRWAAALLQGFGMAHKLTPLRGEPWIFYWLRQILSGNHKLLFQGETWIFYWLHMVFVDN